MRCLSGGEKGSILRGRLGRQNRDERVGRRCHLVFGIEMGQPKVT